MITKFVILLLEKEAELSYNTFFSDTQPICNYTHLLDKTQHMMSRTLTDTSEDGGTGTEWVHERNRTSIGNREKKGKSVPLFCGNQNYFTPLSLLS